MRFDQAVAYSRDPVANASLAEQEYPPPMLLEFYYSDPKAADRAEQALEKLLRAIGNFFGTPEIVELSRHLIVGDHRIEARFSLEKLNEFRLEGQVDLAGEDDHGVQVVDWKLGSATGSNDSLQLVTYGWWAAQEFGVATNQGACPTGFPRRSND